MKNTFSLLIIYLLICYSCESPSTDLGIATNYLPSETLLQKGIVNKYYVHRQATDDKDISTHIEYRSYQLVGDKLIHNYYDPDFKLSVRKEFQFDNNQMILSHEERYWRQDTLTVRIIKSKEINWENQTGESQKIIQHSWGTREYQSKQISNQDTSVLNNSAKIFKDRVKVIGITETDTFPYNYQVKSIFVKDIGLYSQIVQDSLSRHWKELVEQIPLEEFQKQASHGRHRIAYIDSTATIDKKDSFQLCGIHQYIYDYYNGRQLIHYKGGKKAIWSTIKNHLDKEKLFKESGYLTFRFVVNCKGEKGRIITEQADLDFQKKTFNKETVHHFYTILQEINDWIPTKIREENVDAYFYLTFKLEDGMLVELLP